jgi:MipA family protein
MKNRIAKHVRIVLFFVFLLQPNIVANAAEMTVSIDNPPAEGTVVFVLFDSANTFGDLRDPAREVKQSLDGSRVFYIHDVPHGEYALMVYHDENENGRLDKNFIGIPTEPLGFSNRYKPKGPPSFKRAAFVLKEEELRHFDVELDRPLGEYGRLGVGVGVIARSSPYRDYNSGVYQVIPAITYNGNRLQIYGPNIQVGLVGSGKLRLAATGKYRIGVYEEGESNFLTGMGDREDTVMAGLAFQAELPGGVNLSLGYEHDILDRIGGGGAKLGLTKSFQFGVIRFSPEIGLNWLSSELSNHDFGVPDSKATMDRPAYYPDDTTSVEGGLRVFIEITTSWLMIANASVELLDDKVTDSPIVEKHYVVKGFAAINYLF